PLPSSCSATVFDLIFLALCPLSRTPLAAATTKVDRASIPPLAACAARPLVPGGLPEDVGKSPLPGSGAGGGGGGGGVPSAAVTASGTAAAAGEDGDDGTTPA
ncbi:unnamed protein product, partial [Ectocarpus sp. 12 AP-2014]